MKSAHLIVLLVCSLLLGLKVEVFAQKAADREPLWHRNQTRAARAGKGGLLTGLMERRKAAREAKRATVRQAQRPNTTTERRASSAAPKTSNHTNTTRTTQDSKKPVLPKEAAKIHEAKGFTPGKNKRYRRRYTKVPLFGN